MTVEQINEALARWDRNKYHENHVWHELAEAARDHLTCLGDWVTCPTCNGDGTYVEEYEQGYETPLRVTKPCPYCVDGLVPSPELVERIKEETRFGDKVIKMILLASRQGDPA